MNISNTTSAAMSGCQHAMSGAMQQRGQDFRALAKAIESGDLDASKEAYATFQETLKNNGSSRPDPFFSDSESQTSKDLAAIGKALESGDIDAAKEAMATLKSDMDSVRGNKMHGPPPPPPTEESEETEETSIDWQAILDAATQATDSGTKTTRTSFLAFA